MLLGVGLIYTLAGDELLKGGFIDPFVDVLAAVEAFQIACRFGILVLIMCRTGLLLHMEEVFDDLGSVVFLANGAA